MITCLSRRLSSAGTNYSQAELQGGSTKPLCVSLYIQRAMNDGKRQITAKASPAESGPHGGTFCLAYSSCVTQPEQRMELVGFMPFIRTEQIEPFQPAP